MEEVTNSVQNKLGGLQEVVFIHRLFQINFFSLIHSWKALINFFAVTLEIETKRTMMCHYSFINLLFNENGKK